MLPHLNFTDRPGEDITNFVLDPSKYPDPIGECARRCCNESDCNAWVLAVQPSPYWNCTTGQTCCYLKVGVLRARASGAP